MCSNFFNKNSLLVAAAVFLVMGSLPAFAQTPEAAGDCNIEVCYVKMTADGFDPETMTISQETTVVWKNVDEKVHSLEIIAGETRSEAVIISPGEVYSYKFPADKSHEFTYFDAENGKSGQLVVDASQEPSPVNPSKVDFTDPRSGISDISLVRGAMTGVEIMPDLRALLVTVDVQTRDVLQLTINRELLDSRNGEKDAPFSVRAGSEPLDFNEVGANTESRTLRITVPAGTESITIKGSSVAAEALGYRNAYSALSEAASVIAEYKAKDVVTNEADDLLLQATDAAALGKYHFATDLASEAIEAAQRADRMAVAANTVMNEAETSIMTTKSLGGDVSQAEELLDHTKEVYSYGGYEEALNLADYAKDVASTRINTFWIIGAVGMAAAAVLYVFYRRQPSGGKAAEVARVENDDGSNLKSVFVEKPHLREDDRQVLKYIVDRGGEALLAEIRNQFNLPKSTAWRLMRRLEREELVEISKFGNQNMVRYKLKAEAH